MGRVKSGENKIVRLRRAPRAAPSHCAGWFVGWSDEVGCLVDFAGSELGPVPARAIIPIDAATVADAIRAGHDVLLAFDEDDLERPIILGLLQPVTPVAAESSGAPEVDLTIDGRRLALEAAEEIVLRCGRASITMRRNGRVEIRGTYLETTSEGVNRIKGGTVQIN